MAVQWQDDIDAALDVAKAQTKPVLIDFTAAPA
jgi:hypothetical protein